MVSPNPAKDAMTVTIYNETEEVKNLKNVQIELYQFNTGTKQKQWTFNNNQKQFSLNLNGITKGMYVIRVTIGKQQQSVKIIIE